MNKTVIAPYKKLDLKIYGYTLPHVDTHAGCVKVGETTQRDVRDRILQKQQQPELSTNCSSNAKP